MSEMKTCSKCGVEYPATTEYFAFAKGNKDRMRYWCDSCERRRVREYYLKHGRPTYAYVEDAGATKTCIKCGKSYPATTEYFTIDTTNKSGLHGICKSCDRARSREWHQSHKEQANANRRAYHWEHLEVDKDKLRRWHKENKDAVRVLSHRRLALLHSCGGDFTAAQWEAVKQMFDYRCPRCGKREPEIRLTVDHIIPLSQGGRGDIGNIQPLCKSCNSAKGARVVIDYRVGLQTLEITRQYSLWQ